MHSTFYEWKGERRIYTTIKHTPYHKHLRDLGGRTWKHDKNDILYLCIGIPLDKPLYSKNEIKEQ